MLSLSLVVSMLVDSVGMEEARYPAASTKPDTTAPGGFGGSENFPVANDATTAESFLSLKRVGERVEVTVSNSETPDLWIQAADSNLRGWLEARVGDEWKPIQYHQWSTCGNSYHSVFLPVGHHWTYSVAVPKGSLKTEVRFALLTTRYESESKGLEYSKPIVMSLSPLVLKLSAERAASYRVHQDWTVPTLVLREMVTGG